MVECNKVNVKLWYSQLNKLKPAVKNEYENVWWKKFAEWIIFNHKT